MLPRMCAHLMYCVPKRASLTTLSAQNGTMGRSHREDQEKFYAPNRFSSAADLRRKLHRWNDAYNDLEYCGLNCRAPNEVLFEVPKCLPNTKSRAR